MEQYGRDRPVARSGRYAISRFLFSTAAAQGPPIQAGRRMCQQFPQVRDKPPRSGRHSTGADM